MIRTIVSRTINASAPEVFKAVSDISGLPETNPDIVKIEFLTDRKSGAGTRFRETWMMKGRESVTELEITELDENSHIRMSRPAGNFNSFGRGFSRINTDKTKHNLVQRLF